MKNNRRLWWVGMGVILLALVLAFPLRDVFQRTVVVPLAYFIWALGLFYRSMPQVAWWILAVMIATMILVGSLGPAEKFNSRQMPKVLPPQGQVEGLAISIHKTRLGVYFKWLVANRLGKLAYQMLVRCEGDRNRSVFAPLVSADWQPDPRLQKYLETGLHGSFSDYPDSERFTRTTASPLDLDVREAVEFLEAQLETKA